MSCWVMEESQGLPATESAGARGGELCTPRASSMPVAPYVSPARTPDPRHGDLHTSMDMVEGMLFLQMWVSEFASSGWAIVFFILSRSSQPPIGVQQYVNSDNRCSDINTYIETFDINPTWTSVINPIELPLGYFQSFPRMTIAINIEMKNLTFSQETPRRYVSVHDSQKAAKTTTETGPIMLDVPDNDIPVTYSLILARKDYGDQRTSMKVMGQIGVSLIRSLDLPSEDYAEDVFELEIPL